MAERQAHIDNQKLQYIARISHGKDSLKMLDVIISRGLPLDRITTTDVWATDTIRGEYPKPDGHSVHDYDRRFPLEDEHLLSPDGPFFWKKLEEDLQYSLF